MLNSCPDSSTFNFQHSMFVVNPIDKHAFDSDTWVLDRCHKPYSPFYIFITSITSIKHTFVQLPNKEKVLVTHIGTIQVPATLVLKDVLCVPSITFNLISITKLTKTMSCCLIFLSEFCFIQDLLCWK